MATLEIELSYLPLLIDTEVEEVLEQLCHWKMLYDCAAVFPIDVGHIDFPLNKLPELISRKADEYLTNDRAEAFKRTWQQLEHELQISLVLRAAPE